MKDNSRRRSQLHSSRNKLIRSKIKAIGAAEHLVLKISHKCKAYLTQIFQTCIYKQKLLTANMITMQRKNTTCTHKIPQTVPPQTKQIPTLSKQKNITYRKITHNCQRDKTSTKTTQPILQKTHPKS